MPINYLEIQAQVKEYCMRARHIFQAHGQQTEKALELLRRCAHDFDNGLLPENSLLSSPHPKYRCARPAEHKMDACFKCHPLGPYALVAADGSQITSNHHDALPISLINIAGVSYQPGSGDAPQINVRSEFIRDEADAISLKFIPDDQVNLARDVAEAGLLADWSAQDALPLVALCDGTLELFHEPRTGAIHEQLFNDYLNKLTSINQAGKILGGYIDKPRARLVLRMLEILYSPSSSPDLDELTDTDLFSRILAPGCRSAIFRLNSPSSPFFTDSISLFFFYLNVGRPNNPWIVRVETLQATAGQPDQLLLLQQALLDQCKLMSNRPYPYILHRAHEEAVVSFAEKEELTQTLVQSLQASGVVFGEKSYKLDAKELGKRTRL